jgi:glyoxylate/hydroxypyruvate reductase
MRIHVQNPEGESLFPITPAQWEAAAARHSEIGGLAVSFGTGDPAFAEAMREAEVLVTWTKEVKARFPCPAPRLRLIQCTSAGLDRLAPFDWLPQGVALLNNRGTHAAKAGEFALMALLMLANHIPVFADQQRGGEWKPRFANVLAGRRLLVVGLGSLGGAAARHASAFGMRVIGVSRSGVAHEACAETHPQAMLEALLPQAEFLVLACPLTEETRGLMDRRRLSLLPKGAKVVNMARGAVWDQEAACDLLEAGHLAGCVTDVAVPEPLPAGHRLWRTPGMLVTPHMSSDDPATYNDRTLDILFANLRAWREGKSLPNRVDPARGY